MSIFHAIAKTPKSGKGPVHLLPYHLLDVAACLNTLLTHEPMFLGKLSQLWGYGESETVRILTFLYALHDLGKYSPYFQRFVLKDYPDLAVRFGLDNVVYAKEPQGVRHDTVLHFLVRDNFFRRELERRGCLTSDYVIDPPRRTRQRDTLAKIMIAVAGHHGYPTPHLRFSHLSSIEGKSGNIREDCINQFCHNGQTINTSVSLERALQCCEALRDLFGPIHLDLKDMTSRDLATFTWLLSGIGTMSDWLGSTQEFFPFKDDEVPLAEYWEAHALPNARIAYKSSGLASSEVRQSESFYSSILPTNAYPRPLQQAISSIPDADGLFIIEDAMGSGKTEGAQGLSRKHLEDAKGSGIFFALPTQASSDAMFTRVKEFCGPLFTTPATLALAHGSAYLSLDFRDVRLGKSDNVECANWIGDKKKTTLWAQVGVGTIDQVVMAVLPNYHANMRLAGLARSVLIVDEVHSYDEYQTTLLCAWLEFAGRLQMPVILLSATLSQDARQKLVTSYSRGWTGLKNTPKIDKNATYPLITTCKGSTLAEYPQEAYKRTSYRFIQIEDSSISARKSEDRIWSSAEEVVLSHLCQATERGNAVWFRNSVRDAQIAYDNAVRKIGRDNVLLAHARYTRGRRSAIDRQAIFIAGKDSAQDQRRGKLVICTQVFQESLDLDFDVAASDLCPVDILLQRLGRVQRHVRDSCGNRIEGALDARNRGDSIPVYLLTPKYEETPKDSWGRCMSMFSTLYVYPAIRLWRTLRLVREMPVWELPSHVRTLVEGVYGEGAPTPVGLESSLRDVEKSQDLYKAKARDWAARWDQGFCCEGTNAWQKENGLVATTRVDKDPSQVWRMAIYDEKLDQLVPFEQTWALSEITLRFSIVADAPLSETSEAAYIRQSSADYVGPHKMHKNPWTHYIVGSLRNHKWISQGFVNGRRVLLEYCEIKGMTYEKF